MKKFGITAGQNIKQGYVKTTQGIGRAAGGLVGAVGGAVPPTAVGPVLAIMASG